MNNVQLQNLIFADEGRIVEAISTGAAWEAWMHVELILILRAAGLQAALDVPYPPPHFGLQLNCVCQDSAGVYAIEMKVESASNFGAQIINGINQDRAKIACYLPQNPGARWVCGIGYSVSAVQAMQNFANVQGNNAIFAHPYNLGVLVASV